MKRKAIAIIDKTDLIKKARQKKSRKGYVTIPKRLKGYVQQSGYYGRYSGKNSELKFLDNIITSYTIDSTGEVVPITTPNTTGTLCQIAQGTTESQRIGRKCVIQKIDVKGYLTQPGSATAGDFIQIVLVWDKQANGAIPAYTDIFVSNAINSFNNLSNSGRFIILKRWRQAISPVSSLTTTTTVSRTYPFKYSKKCNIPLEYSSTTGAITELKSNNLMLFAISAYDDVTTLNAQIRLRFSDGN